MNQINANSNNAHQPIHDEPNQPTNQDKEAMRKVDGDFSDGKAPGLDNLLYSADADFSCFAVCNAFLLLLLLFWAFLG